MPMIETPAELAEQIATMAGVYGAHCDEEEGECRVCFVSGMTQRIRDAVANEHMINRPRAGGSDD